MRGEYFMSRFMYEGSKNPGDGSAHPIKKKLKRALYNAKVSLTQDKFSEARSIEKIGRL